MGGFKLVSNDSQFVRETVPFRLESPEFVSFYCQLLFLRKHIGVLHSSKLCQEIVPGFRQCLRGAKAKVRCLGKKPVCDAEALAFHCFILLSYALNETELATVSAQLVDAPYVVIIHRTQEVRRSVLYGLGDPLFTLLVEQVSEIPNLSLMLEAIDQCMIDCCRQRRPRVPGGRVMPILPNTGVGP